MKGALHFPNPASSMPLAKFNWHQRLSWRRRNANAAERLSGVGFLAIRPPGIEAEGVEIGGPEVAKKFKVVKVRFKLAHCGAFADLCPHTVDPLFPLVWERQKCLARGLLRLDRDNQLHSFVVRLLTGCSLAVVMAENRL